MSQQSAPYKMDEMLYQRHVEKFALANVPYCRLVRTRLGTISDSTDIAELHVKLVLQGIAAIVNSDKCHNWPEVYPVGRLEIFGDWHTVAAQNTLHDQGMVLFDVNGLPLLHVVHALIGYGGSGPALTKAIFSDLGISPAIFEEIQRAHRDVLSTDSPYHVVVQSSRDDEDHLTWHWSSVTESAWR